MRGGTLPVRQGDGDQAQVDAGAAADGPADLQPVGLPEKTVFTDKGAGPGGGLLQIGHNGPQIGLKGLFRGHDLRVERAQLLRGTHSQIAVEKVGGLLIVIQGGGVLALPEERTDDQGVKALVQVVQTLARWQTSASRRRARRGPVGRPGPSPASRYSV